jgi:hypothetical protein
VGVLYVIFYRIIKEEEEEEEEKEEGMREGGGRFVCQVITSILSMDSLTRIIDKHISLVIPSIIMTHHFSSFLITSFQTVIPLVNTNVNFLLVYTKGNNKEIFCR